METRRLQVLLELSRTGSMRAVAEALGTTTSTVSQQIAALAKETGTALVEPVGRGVRLTPAGRRLADHAVDILTAVDAAYVDLDPSSEPTGTVRVAGFATAIRRTLLPIVDELAIRHPAVQLVFHEYEPAEAFELLAADKVDLALAYDYNLAPLPPHPELNVTPMWSAPWGLGVPAGDDVPEGNSLAVFTTYRDRPWIGNSRNTADEQVLRAIGAMADFEPLLTHTADSLDLVEDLIVAGLGVGLLPAAKPTRAEVRLLPLTDPCVTLRAFTVTRRGHAGWPALSLVLRMLVAAEQSDEHAHAHRPWGPE